MGEICGFDSIAITEDAMVDQGEGEGFVLGDNGVVLGCGVHLG